MQSVRKHVRGYGHATLDFDVAPVGCSSYIAGTTNYVTNSLLLFGFLLGLKHALDVDHVVAVSAIVSERKGIWRSSLMGLFWGIGHAGMLLLVGLAVIVLGFTIPDRVALMLEFTVAMMIMLLGIQVLLHLRKGGSIHVHAHKHGGHIHVHPHFHPATERRDHQPTAHAEHFAMPMRRLRQRWMHYLISGKKSLLVGMMHGLAGSGAVMLLVLTSISSTSAQLFYLALFGVGSVIGMLVMSTLIGLPFALSARKSERLNLIVRGCSGVVSVGFGLFLALKIGLGEGLFL